MEHGANVNICDKMGISPISLAASSCNLRMVILLIKNGAVLDADLTKSYGPSLISKAAAYKDFEAVKILVDFGIDPTDCIIKSANKDEILKFLSNHGSDLNQFMKKVASDGNYKAVKLFARHGVELNAMILSEFGLNLLCKAASDGNYKAIMFLVTHGVELNAAIVNEFGLFTELLMMETMKQFCS